ncbi:hypothetical protein [Candidatus Coxiella mudrowiae]|uniref:hypothetical protein n=1 Tax=Candidatus Coxiella mudrowiae TaxID=2054173 RepID=UPI000A40D802|nr:hypothetical protein [Candidatus Coxiella mudrowiae]
MKVFCLRETGRGKTFSDQDLVVIGAKPIPIETINGLKFEFSNSDLPILVDIVDWNAILKNFVKKLQEVV